MVGVPWFEGIGSGRVILLIFELISSAASRCGERERSLCGRCWMGCRCLSDGDDRCGVRHCGGAIREWFRTLTNIHERARGGDLCRMVVERVLLPIVSVCWMSKWRCWCSGMVELRRVFWMVRLRGSKFESLHFVPFREEFESVMRFPLVWRSKASRKGPIGLCFRCCCFVELRLGQRWSQSDGKVIREGSTNGVVSQPRWSLSSRGGEEKGVCKFRNNPKRAKRTLLVPITQPRSTNTHVTSQHSRKFESPLPIASGSCLRRVVPKGAQRRTDLLSSQPDRNGAVVSERRLIWEMEWCGCVVSDR